MHLPIYKSDHAPILLKAGNRDPRGMQSRLFKFESLWLSSEECKNVVASSWHGGVGDFIPLKIAVVAEKLSSWSAATFGNIKKRIKEAKKKLKEARVVWQMLLCLIGVILSLWSLMNNTS